MKTNTLNHSTLGKLLLIGLLFFPFALSHAEELVGKPVPVDEQFAADSSAQKIQSSSSRPVDVAAPTNAVTSESSNATNSDSSQANIRSEMEEMRHDFHENESSGLGSFSLNPDTLIPIVAMLLLFGGPVLLVIVLATLHYRSKVRRQQNINMNIDKLLAAGRDIPIELMLAEDSSLVKIKSQGTVYTRDDALLHKGIINIGLGVGVGLFLTILCGFSIGAVGFIIIGLGISRVAIWILSGTKVATSKAPD